MEKEYYINHTGRRILFTLLRTQRKTIGITITKDGAVKVAAPIRATERQILEIVNKKASWIIKKLEEIEKSLSSDINERRYENGSRVFYLGREYVIGICRDYGIKRPVIELYPDKINIKLLHDNVFDESQIKAILREWYVKQFEVIIKDRISRYSSIIGVRPSKVTIKEQKTRWGSCSTKGNINLNWKLVMAPLEVVDYVIVHELSHMRRMDHSYKFWEIVGNILPEYSDRRKWLRVNGSKLFF